jgi:tetratricopeptide (TPR) repeat protein
MQKPVSPNNPVPPDQALLLERESAEVHHRAGRIEPAIAGYRKVLEIEPDEVVSLVNLGGLLNELGRSSEALPLLERAVRRIPDVAAAQFNLANALLALGNKAAALDAYGRAVELKPDHGRAHRARGRLLVEAGRTEEGQASLAIYERWLSDNTGDARALSGLGDLHFEAGRLAAAAAAYRRSIEIEPRNAIVWSMLGQALLKQGRTKEAVAAQRQAVKLSAARNSRILFNSAYALREAGKFEASLADFQRCLALAPDDAEAQIHEAILFLLCGQFAEGWKRYESRWKLERSGRREFAAPQWKGESFAGKTLLLYGEQGFGDAIQFVRYAKLAKERGGSVVLEVRPELVRLLRSAPGVDSVLARGTALPPHDLQCPLMSLPGLFGTTLKSIRAEIPYLSAPPVGAPLAPALKRGAGRFKVGISWAGSPTHYHDYKRSIGLERFLELSAVAGVELFSLQKGTAAEALKIPSMAALVADCGALVTDFADSAALVAALDLVLTVDTSVAHLAGALGKPVWILLPHVGDWRWMRKGEKSPWYPTARLFRQSAIGDWDGVFERVREALAQTIAARAKSVKPAG